MTPAVPSYPRGVAGRWLVSLRTRVRHRKLDEALAEGTDPWTDAKLLARASRLSSLAARRRLARRLVEMVALAEQRHPASAYLQLRHQVVLNERDALLVLSERLHELAPLEVSVVAELELLVSDESSPVYVGGRHPCALAELTSRCLRAVEDD